MGLRKRDWREYNIKKEQRRMGIVLEPIPAKCDDCGGSGVDLGSVAEPEPCKVCLGSGEMLAAEPAIERKPLAVETLNAQQHGATAAPAGVSDQPNLTQAARAK